MQGTVGWFSAYHRHLINDEIFHFRERMLQLCESLSFQVLELSSGGEAKERVEGVTFDVEGSNTSWSGHYNLLLKEKTEAVDEVRLSCTSCAVRTGGLTAEWCCWTMVYTFNCFPCRL